MIALLRSLDETSLIHRRLSQGGAALRSRSDGMATAGLKWFPSLTQVAMRPSREAGALGAFPCPVDRV
jgi:hypothetical protein